MRLPSLLKLPLAALFLTSQTLMAQQPGGSASPADGIEMADQLRADGKIWVVVAVIAAVFVGIIIYLIRLDRQVSRLENEVKRKVSNQPAQMP